MLSTALVVVLLLVGFAGAFIADAVGADHAYDALSVHRVTLDGRLVGCAFTGSPGRITGIPSGHICRYTYSYERESFSLVLPYGNSGTAYVDPRDPSIHMAASSFEGGPRERVGDIVVASILCAAAILVVMLHELHRHRRRSRTI